MKSSSGKKVPGGQNRARKKICIADGCRSAPSVRGYCRLHYISHWKTIKADDKSRAEKRLNSYVDRLAQKYPSDYMDRIKADLEDENKFKETVTELEIEPPGEGETTETEREYLEKLIRGIKDE